MLTVPLKTLTKRYNSNRILPKPITGVETAYGIKGDVDLAFADYNRAIGLKLDFAEAYYNRGVIYVKKGDFDRAISDYTHAIDLKPDYVEAYYGRGNVYYQKGKYARAIADYNEAIDLKTGLCRKSMLIVVRRGYT